MMEYLLKGKPVRTATKSKASEFFQYFLDAGVFHYFSYGGENGGATARKTA